MWYPPTGAWHGKRWYGPDQHENKSPDNIRRAYAYLRSVPYQSAEDRERLNRLEVISIAEAMILHESEGLD